MEGQEKALRHDRRRAERLNWADVAGASDGRRQRARAWRRCAACAWHNAHARARQTRFTTAWRGAALARITADSGWRHATTSTLSPCPRVPLVCDLTRASAKPHLLPPLSALSLPPSLSLSLPLLSVPGTLPSSSVVSVATTAHPASILPLSLKLHCLAGHFTEEGKRKGDGTRAGARGILSRLLRHRASRTRSNITPRLFRALAPRQHNRRTFASPSSSI